MAARGRRPGRLLQQLSRADAQCSTPTRPAPSFAAPLSGKLSAVQPSPLAPLKASRPGSQHRTGCRAVPANGFPVRFLDRSYLKLEREAERPLGGTAARGLGLYGGETVSRHGAPRVTQRLYRGATREGFGWGATTEVPAMRFTSNTLRLCLSPLKPSMNQWFHFPSTSVLRPHFVLARYCSQDRRYRTPQIAHLIERPVSA